MNNFFTSLAVTALPFISLSQSFAPPAGQPGSTAIHKDSSVFLAWATHCEVQRGYMNIEDPSLGYASFGNETDATGPAGGTTTSVVSLGDGGTATLTFDGPITNGNGPDFAVFENGLSDTFLEIGFVEVSSDGQHFVRFPAVSEVQTDTQIGGFGSVDCRYIHNFAGKYRVGYGTPFDLEDLKDSAGIDLNAVTHVRIVDAIGSIDPTYATYDSQGTIVNNLHPTPFESSGFDLDAVGLIHVGTVSLEQKETSIFALYPNPATTTITVQSQQPGDYTVTTMMGKVVLSGELTTATHLINISDLKTGIYFLSTVNGQCLKFVKK
ncbi:T9SS type A sorting domain-containing protein [Crocinitomicaceae bacterium CZZ-1]|uniref:T9SS type A sorting domain-containing protein n=1 Tax=Taishania pollutisoli TaxID=2766479 RepID=A0A8J6PMK1_9FLAO|nr:T9SS type A sorting domain-containing protein [Taishania pollutisoli]MBC9813605.1 T9SS type A sorting domain-containing protein [Taishania pollutisoli]